MLQSLKTGATEIADVPCPTVKHGQLLIRSTHTLVSVGTERMLVEFGKAGWIDKARLQPEKVRMVLDKIKTDGLLPTVEAVFNKLDQPLPLGYCNVGTVLELGEGVGGFAKDERVVSNGNHAEVVCVPVNLCAKVPASVPDEDAAFTVLGVIALQGIRLVHPTLGESVVVTGLGLVGLMTVQLLRAHGCRVLGIDFDVAKLALARQFGAEVVDLSAGEDAISAASRLSRGRGVDAVIITASTKSNAPVHQAALMSRKRGRIVLVGVTGLELSRADFYEKELSFQVSCSYGPGRHDPNYEERGQDYPFGFVRWTEQRNFEAVLDMMADGRINVKPMISHRFGIAEADQAYSLVTGDMPSLGILLSYPTPSQKSDAALRIATVELSPKLSDSGISQAASPRATVAFLGAGNYATAILIPAFKAADARLRIVASAGGVSGVHAGRKFGFEATTTDIGSVFADSSINTVVIATRHDTHANLVCEALRAGKHVFVEKPICLATSHLDQISACLAENPSQLLMIGFNRRFAPHIMRIKSLLASQSDPLHMVMTVNAGAIPKTHWTQDRAIGGGRIVGEACHFVDLLMHISGSTITAESIVRLRDPTSGQLFADSGTLTLEFQNGSLGVIHYLANGDKGVSKERLEIFCGGRILQLDNFIKLRGWGWPHFSKMNLWRQNKGANECVAEFVRCITTGDAPTWSNAEMLQASRVAIALEARMT